MKYSVAVVLVLTLLVVSSSKLSAQDQSSSAGVVNLFKSYINDGNIVGMLSLYGDVDINTPLQPSNYERMRGPMSTLQGAWSGQPFILLSDSSTVIHVSSPLTHEYIKFYTAQYDAKWYIKDTEVYDK